MALWTTDTSTCFPLYLDGFNLLPVTMAELSGCKRECGAHRHLQSGLCKGVCQTLTKVYVLCPGRSASLSGPVIQRGGKRNVFATEGGKIWAINSQVVVHRSLQEFVSGIQKDPKLDAKRKICCLHLSRYFEDLRGREGRFHQIVLFWYYLRQTRIPVWAVIRPSWSCAVPFSSG